MPLQGVGALSKLAPFEMPDSGPTISAVRHAPTMEDVAREAGVILDDLRSPFFAEIAGGVEELASELGYQLLLGAGGRQARRERAALATLLEYRVDGVILVSPRMRAAD